MKVHQIYTNSPLDNFSYIIEYGKEAICIDPYYSKQINDFLESRGLKLMAIINTHEHDDHTCGNLELKKKHECQVLSFTDVPGINRELQDREIIQLEFDSYIEVILTKGHTDNSITLKVFEDNKNVAIITGDTLFNAGVGNCYGGSIEDMYETVKEKLLDLEDEVLVYPGHDYYENNCGFSLSVEPENAEVGEYLEKYKEFRANNEFLVNTIADEKKINPFFRLDSKNLRKNLDMGENTEKEVFFKLRKLRNKW